MIRFTSLFLACLFCLSLGAQDSLNISQVKTLDRGSSSYSGSWVYVNDAGEEYGLVGANQGTAIYSLEEGMDDELAFIPGPPSRWREITVVGAHAFVTTEGTGDGEGLQVLELSNLPDTAFLLTTYDSTFTTGHILQKDIFRPDDPYIYVSGTRTTGGVHILDISDPANPVEIGLHNPGQYVHDVHIREDRMYTFQFNQAIIEVVDISDKTNPTLITTIQDPGGATHSGWTTDDNNFLIVADERDGFDGRIFDIRDIENVTAVSTFTSNPATFVHNPYVRGDFVYLAHNREGLRVYDVVDPSNPIEVGFYDTVTDANPGSGGLWSACPFIPSGKVIGGDRDLGLLVWEIDEVRASRFSGIVRDAITLEPIDDVRVVVRTLGSVFFTDGFGAYKGGQAGESVIEIEYEKEGYLTEQRTVSLSIDDPQILDVLLQPTTVSTLDASNNVEWSIWPNPARDFIQMNLASTGDYRAVQLHDMHGRLVSTQSISGEESIYISTEDLSNGVYTLSLLDADKQIVAVKRVSIIR